MKFTDDSETGKRYAWILKTVMDELLDEMADEDNGQLEEWFATCGQFIAWIGTGNADDLPALMREKFSISPESTTTELAVYGIVTGKSATEVVDEIALETHR
jgi:uncharacterized protein CbrC (UPF0167 family)